MSSPSGGQWEELRKEARKLESEIDQKLAAFSKIGSGSASSSESANLLGESQRGDMINSKALEIEGLLERLSDLNEAMGGLVNSGGAVARMHTLARHKDILMEFTQEFRRTRSTVTVDMRHHELLRGSTGITSSMDFLGGQVCCTLMDCTPYVVRVILRVPDKDGIDLHLLYLFTVRPLTLETPGIN
jgi:Golgi SNAP receptor complex protein 1